jgi:8-oxo-dGTP pyrophosphatase MutT (NUDIX family)
VRPNLLDTSTFLRPGHAAAALLIRDDGYYILQRRDDIPGIWYPGHWGMFGGGLDPGEDEFAALRRELREEIDLDLQEASLFVRFNYDLTSIKLGCYIRAYYEVQVSSAEFDLMVLHEGAEMRAFPGDEALMLSPMSPYDGFALLLHHQRARLLPPE